MKKIVSLLSLLVVMSMMFLSVSAASGINAAEQTVLNNYKAGVMVGGTLVAPTAGEVNTAYNLLNHDDVNLSADDAAAVNKAIDDIYAVFVSEGKTTLNALSTAGKQTVLSIASEAAWPLGFTFTYDAASDTANIWSEGNVIATSSTSGSVVKQTGFGIDMSFVLGLGLILMLSGAGYVATKKDNA